MTSLPFSLVDTTLLTGPSNTGKTRLTAHAMEAWVADCGPTGVVALDFAPEVEYDSRLLGGRLSRFTIVPHTGWYGVIEAHAPRAEGESNATVHELATTNSENAVRLLDAAPADPTAVFVNDATIPFQSGDLAPCRLTEYCDRAEVAVLNAFESDELGTEHPVSRHERDALAVLKRWVNQIVGLE
jgi:hypothetical protein